MYYIIKCKKRSHNLYLTEEGLRIKPEIINILTESSEILTENISQEDLKKTKRVMKQMSNNI